MTALPMPCLAVMARAPLAGDRAIKTRLRSSVPRPDDRMALYRAFLADVLATCRRLRGVTLRVAFTPADGAEAFAEFDLEHDTLLAQRGRSLGDRERHLFEDLFAQGFDPVVIIGSDLPTVPRDCLRGAFDLLAGERHAVALGPAEDGGYYLIGLRAPRGGRPVPDLFSGIRWSTPHALNDTRAAAQRAGLVVREAPLWFDVDEEAALARLIADLRQEPRRAPATAGVLRRLGLA